MKSLALALLFLLFTVASFAAPGETGHNLRHRNLKRARVLCLDLKRRGMHNFEVIGANRQIYGVLTGFDSVVRNGSCRVRTTWLKERLQHEHYFCAEIGGEVVEFLSPEGTRKYMTKEVGATAGPCDVEPDRKVTITEV